MQLKGRVIKGVGGLYFVSCGKKVYTCRARNKLHEKGLYVGDQCELNLFGQRGVVEEVANRKNLLSRPTVANVDKVIIVTAPLPVADFSLVDKIILNCLTEGIDFLVAVNKKELASDSFLQKVKENYGILCDVCFISAKEKGAMEPLLALIDKGVFCLAGQSGVGKTSLLNALIESSLETGELSKKIGRGKNTTRHAEIFMLKDAFIVDTPGFSLLDLEEDKIASKDLHRYYPDFYAALEKEGVRCHFKDCTHTTEPNCAIKELAQKGAVCGERLERYAELYYNLVQREKEKY